MYVRVFKADEIKRWNVKDIDDLPILALKLWNPKKDNDYSIFKFEDKKDSYWAALRALVSNSNEWGYGVDLLILSDEFLKEFNIEDDKEKLTLCNHSNIKNLTFKDYRLFIEYTYKNQENLISFTIKDIKEIFNNLSTNDSKDFKALCDSYSKNKEIYKFVKKVYYDKEEILPNFLKDLC